jgi:hypothetical protein
MERVPNHIRVSRPRPIVERKPMTRVTGLGIGACNARRDVLGPFARATQVCPWHAGVPQAGTYVGSRPIEGVENRFEEFVACLESSLEALKGILDCGELCLENMLCLWLVKLTHQAQPINQSPRDPTDPKEDNAEEPHTPGAKSF